MSASPVQQIVQALTRAKSVLITCHRKPDGDAMGSMLAVGLILRRLGKDCTLYSQDGVPKQFADLVGADDVVDQVSAEARFDVTVAVDTGDKILLGDQVPGADRSGTVIVLDHHSSSTPFGDLRWHDATAAATGVLVAELAGRLDVAIDVALAEHLWCALYTDTGGFRYSSTDARVLRLAAALVDVGISPWEVTVKLYENNPVQRVRLLGEVLNTLELSASGQIASLAITNSMVERSGADDSMLDGFINYARSIQGVEVAVQVLQQGESCRINLRSKGRIDVGELAQRLGGGGHHNAAGCTLKGPPNEVQRRILALLEQALLDQDVPK